MTPEEELRLKDIALNTPDEFRREQLRDYFETMDVLGVHPFSGGKLAGRVQALKEELAIARKEKL